MNNAIDYNQPVEQLLAGKAKYHQEQIDFHKAALKEVNQLIRAAKTGGEVNETFVAFNSYKAPSEKVVPPAISQDRVKPLVIEYLKTNIGAYKTTDIYEHIKSIVDTSQDDRRSWVTAISLALNTLSKGEFPRVLKKDTDNGNIKVYEWNRA